MLHDSHEVWAKPTRPKGGSYPTSIGGQHGEKEQRNQKEAEAKGGYTNDKIKDPKSYCHTTKEGQTSVETKKSFEVHHYTTKNRQDGVEAEETTALYVHFSGTVRPIKQE
jgi:hypothetical protein